MTEDAPQAGRPNGAETPPSEGRGVWGFLQALRSSFGNRFLGFMVLNYFGLKGIVLAVLQAAMLPYFQNMGVKEVQYQLATVVAMIPWSMSFIGVLSDIVPIGRFHKKGYLLLSAVLGFVGLLELGFQHQDNCWVAASFFALPSSLPSTCCAKASTLRSCALSRRAPRCSPSCGSVCRWVPFWRLLGSCIPLTPRTGVPGRDVK
eukprot:g13741.t1